MRLVCLTCSRRSGWGENGLNWRLRCPYCGARLAVHLPMRKVAQETGKALWAGVMAVVALLLAALIVILLAIGERR